MIQTFQKSKCLLNEDICVFILSEKYLKSERYIFMLYEPFKRMYEDEDLFPQSLSFSKAYKHSSNINKT